MRIEVSVMMQVHVPDDTDLEDLSLEIDESGLRFVSNGQTVADSNNIEDYYIDDIESDEDDFDDDWDDEEEEDEE
ncbi:MAG: hypothetical protein NZN28_05915 [Meiothermus sp.]|uniref:hypothetical protein n=1 Tax=Meiothermus sp. TaxID=1955249 RepID=UPI0025D55CAF|nr:hypothetical protein [Meiothermus sp.]MCS7068152.1 hypothetical protein [Meiothermus sp.]